MTRQAANLKRAGFDLKFRNLKVCLGSHTKLMGILNVTTDSFSDGGLFSDPGLAQARALQIQEEGADFLDIGGESSRPGAQKISVQQEISRVRPVLKRLSKKIKIPISVDTTKLEVAQMALDEGATIINDIEALQNKLPLAKMIARYKAGVVLMHMQGTPFTMQKNPTYKNVCRQIAHYLKCAIQNAKEAGIESSKIIIDPGFGFGKTFENNLEILKNLNYFSRLNAPILVGLSRKSFIGQALLAPVGDRLFGSLAAAAVAVERGAHIVRVHDVRAHRQLVDFLDQINAKRKV